MPHSRVINLAPQGRLSISSFVRTSFVSSRYPFTYSSYSERSKCTRSRFFSSSAAVAAPKRMESPKSFAASPGIIVSRSIMHRPFPLLESKRILFNFVSLCVTRSGSVPSSCRLTSTAQSSFLFNTKSISGRHPALRFFKSRFRATSKASNRLTVL